MSSINTNLGAMVALDTLKGINKNLGMVQNEISTGKSINSAKDNAAIWSISTVMETDVAGFEKIGNSLNLGSATVGVARTAAEDVVTNLQDIRDSIIAAQEGNVDRDKIQFDIDEAVAQIKSTVAGAQFNGSNLLSDSGEISILSSLDRSSDGKVSAAQISVNKANLSTTDTRVDAVATDDGFAVTTTDKPEFVAETRADVQALTIGAIADAENYTYDFSVNGEAISVTGASGDSQDDIAAKIVAAITAAGPAGVTANVNNDDLSQIDLTIETGTDATITGLAVTDGTSAVAAAAAGGAVVGDAGDQSALQNEDVAYVSPLKNTVAPNAEGVQALAVGAIADAENYTYDFSIGGEDISVTGASGDDQDAIAGKISAAIAAAGVTGVSASSSGGNVTLDIDAGTDASITGLTVTDGTDGVNSATAGGLVLGTAGDQTALNVGSDPVDVSDVKAIEIGTVAAGDATSSIYEATIGTQTASYTATATDTQDDIAAGLTQAINDLEIEGLTAKVNTTTASQIDFDIGANVDADVSLSQKKVAEGSELGALVGLDTLDVTTDAGAAAALTAIEGFLNSAIDSASEFGSKQKRIDSQISFVSSLGDSLKAGISTLTDANLEEASARLQALQVQQQLGVQALSIANQAPQALLGLFR